MKIMVPTIIIIKVLELMGVVHWISLVISPLMMVVSLPDSMGIVWATTMTTSIYADMVIFF
jgi:hypothetical protein